MSEAALAVPVRRWRLDAAVTGIAAVGDRIAVAAGDGALRWFDPAALPKATPAAVPVHDGAILNLAAGAGQAVTGGDDGWIAAIRPDEEPRRLFKVARGWVNHLAADRDSGRIAACAARTVHVLNPDGQERLRLDDHPSTVAAVALTKGGRRVAAAHYGGATVWSAERAGTAKRYDWKGSHLAASFSPDGRFLLTAMQEAALHGWRLADAHDIRMSGYPAKTKSLSWSADGRWLCCSGAEVVTAWDFTGDGPMGRPPRELCPGETLAVIVACHPAHALMAAGFEDGAVRVGQIEDGGEAELPPAGDDETPVSALAWAADGTTLFAGTEGGAIAVYDLARK